MSAAAILTILRNGETIKTCPIEGEAVLGRADGCVIRLEDRAISRQHAVFRVVADGVQVEKKSEFSPVMVNGAEMATKAIVRDADVISIGPYLMRVTVSPSESPATKAKASQQEASASVTAMAEVPEIGGDLPGAGEGQPFDALGIGGSDAQPGMDVGDGVDLSELAPPEADVPALDSPVQAGDLQMDEVHEPIDEDAKTRLTPAAKLSVHLVFSPGTANVTDFELTQDEISIGRGPNCDIILNDKKSSRKNSIIRRAGLSFSIKDLNSANGTFVNGVRVQEQELSGDDMVRIGSVDFQFKAMSADYSAREPGFMRVPEDPVDPAENQEYLSAPSEPIQFPMPGVDPAAGLIAGITGIGPGDVKRMGFIEKLKNFRTLPKKDKIIVGAIMAGLIYFFMDIMFEEPEQEPKKAVAKKTVVSAPSSDKIPLSFSQLSQEKQRFVEAQHALAFDYYKNREYDKSLYELGKIFALIQDYKDSRDIERYAKDGKRKLEAFEEEKRRKEEESRLKVKIQQLVDECQERMGKKEYEQARELFSQITVLDPDNAQVSAWKKEIEEVEEKRRLDEQSKQVQDEINKHAWAVYGEGMAFKKKGKYHSAIQVLGKVGDIGASDRKVVALAAKMIKASFAAIKAARDPILAEAKRLEASSEYPQAFALYKKSTWIDPPYQEGYAGMNRIRGILHDRAKVIYVEAILAESYSDFATAKKKFKECLEVAPVDDVYHERSKRKLNHYFRKEEVGP